MKDTQETDKFDRVKYLENLLKISQETQEESSKRILNQQKTIGSLTDTINELKAQIEKMKCCQNCKHEAVHGVCVSPKRCTNHDKWELPE